MSDTNRPQVTASVDVPLRDVPLRDLRDRIAAVHESHVPMDYAGYIECGCGTECRPAHGGIDVAEQLWAAHVADAVIAELGLGIPCRQTGCRMRQIARRHTQGSGELAGTGDTE